MPGTIGIHLSALAAVMENLESIWIIVPRPCPMDVSRRSPNPEDHRVGETHVDRKSAPKDRR